MPGRPRHNQLDASAFREAICQWQLAARTEVRRSSSLPSSMFDACDPMLEAQLAESVEALLARLHEAPRDIAIDSLAEQEQRTERVTPDELRALPRLIAGHEHAPDLHDGLVAEVLTLLVDASVHGNTVARRNAMSLLRRDYDVDVGADVATTTASLQQCLMRFAGGSAANGDELAEVCRRVAAGEPAERPAGREGDR